MCAAISTLWKVCPIHIDIGDGVTTFYMLTDMVAMMAYNHSYRGSCVYQYITKMYSGLPPQAEINIVIARCY